MKYDNRLGDAFWVGLLTRRAREAASSAHHRRVARLQNSSEQGYFSYLISVSLSARCHVMG